MAVSIVVLLVALTPPVIPLPPLAGLPERSRPAFLNALPELALPNLTLNEEASRKLPAESTFGVALGNDFFSLYFPGNDRGFTSDAEVYATAHLGNTSMRVGVRHSIFTIDADSEADSSRRFDLGRLQLAAKSPIASAGPLELFWFHFVEGIYRGDLGGSQIQDFIHHWPGIEGETLGNGLADDYPGHPRIGVALGQGCGAEIDFSAITEQLSARWSITTHAQLAPLSTGITKIEASTGIHIEARIANHSRIFSSTTVSVGHAVSNDPFLRLPGAYTNELGALWGPTVTLGIRFRSNEGEWMSASIRSTRNLEGTGTHQGSGPMGWLILEWGPSVEE